MFEQEKINLKFIAKNKNLLLFGEDNLKHLNGLFNMFNDILIQESTPYTLSNLNTTILNNNIDVIIINSKENKEEICLYLLEILKYEDIKVLYCQNEEEEVHFEMLNLSNTSFTKSINEELLSYKMYSLLQEKAFDETKTLEDTSNTYVDSFEIQIIFIRDELHHLSKIIDEGDISEGNIHKVKQSINRINKIFENYLMYSKKIKNSMKYFAAMLNKVDLKKASVDNIESFTYLSRIIEDIAIFLDNYFIKRNFTDLYVVEDSLENSLKFLKNSFKAKETSTDDSSLEFFE
ncbi:hypothetical protein [Poseidonibacter lekithochrous]|uniref:hypothetical protein n=1 Tax=Poseidonibacter lekithochrous TaxID=1904463 RepID=UPI0008FC4C75|nr:hypothetical protein [Poseidonibacter lekithochrous]QKJ22671.1 hypothetical protein ALEK_1397 [Poseidonibacter lekithochrous]